VPLVVQPNCPCPGYDSEGNSVFSCDALERARRGALYTLAYSWVNGSPLWSPDLGMTNPKCYVFAYELPEDPCFSDCKAVCEWAARLSAARGTQQTARFLNVGRRLRDLEWASPLPSTTVTLTPLLPGQEDTEQVPALVHGVWKGAGPGAIGGVGGLWAPGGLDEIGLAVANHSDQIVAAPTFEYDASDWSESPVDSYLVLEVAGDLVRQVGTLGGKAPESFSFYRIVPAPELRQPIEGGKSFGKK
jgi:hypothetical protein